MIKIASSGQTFRTECTALSTYETSILPYEDCCTIFLPKHPVINPNLEKCIEYEKSFDFESLIDEAIENIEVITNLENKAYQELL